MTETAITRIAAEIAAVDGLPDLKVEVAQADARALLQILSDYCENDPDTDHTTCIGCDAVLCTSCGLGEEEARCQDDSDGPHCTSCWNHCRTCSLEVAEDAKAEAYADAHGLRY